jgi:hypothetical protein
MLASRITAPQRLRSTAMKVANASPLRPDAMAPSSLMRDRRSDRRNASRAALSSLARTSAANPFGASSPYQADAV